MIYNSNKNPSLWREDFQEDATVLCTQDRIVDDATVFKLRGESFRGKNLETVTLQTAFEPVTAQESTDYRLQIWGVSILKLQSIGSHFSDRDQFDTIQQNMAGNSRR